MKSIDLHIHTNASDGKYSPQEIVDFAIQKGMNKIAITDHDTISAIEEAINYSRGKNIEIINGVEISCEEEKLGIENIHIIGLFIDYKNKNFLELLNKLRDYRVEQKREMVRKLNELGYEINFEEVVQEVGDTFGRCHIAKILIKKYPDKFTKIREVLDELLMKGKPAYVKDKAISIPEAIEAIKNAGGISVLAHPGIYPHLQKILDIFIESGGNGLELNYPYDTIYRLNKEEIIKRIKKISEENNLMTSGGSDFHDEERGTEIGEEGIDETEFILLSKNLS